MCEKISAPRGPREDILSTRRGSRVSRRFTAANKKSVAGYPDGGGTGVAERIVPGRYRHASAVVRTYVRVVGNYFQTFLSVKNAKRRNS